MRKLKYHVATTLDGQLSRADGSFDCFVNEGDHVDDYLHALKHDYDTAVMGRKTWEVGLKYGVTNPYPWLRTYVFSRTLAALPDPALQLVSGDALAVVSRLKEEEGKDIYLCGASSFAGALMKAGLIDEIVLKLNPLVLGAGKPLFEGGPLEAQVDLLSSKTYRNGVLLLRYAVRR